MPSGQLGYGDTAQRLAPSANAIAAGGSASGLATGLDYGCVVRSTGGVRCWGSNLYGVYAGCVHVFYDSIS